MIAILASLACQAHTRMPPGAAVVETSTGVGNVVASRVPPPPPVIEHAEATGPRALSDMVFAIADQNGWFVAYEDAPLRAPADLVDLETGPGIVVKVARTYTDSLDYDPAAGPGAALIALVASHNRAGNPGVFEVRSIGDVTDVVGIGALDASGRYAATPPVLDTIVTLPPGARTIDQGISEVLRQVNEATGQRLFLGMTPMDRNDTGASSEGASARSVILQLLLEGRARYTWMLLTGGSTDTNEWGFSTIPVVEAESAPSPPDRGNLPHAPTRPQ